MNRKLFYILGVTVLLLSMVLAACQPAATPTEAPPPEETEEPAPPPEETEAPPEETEAPPEETLADALQTGVVDRLVPAIGSSS